MKKGKPFGDFAFKAITTRVLPGGKTEVNIEGSATGFPAIVGTVTVQTSNDKSGKANYDWAGVTAAGEEIYGSSTIEWEALGAQRWSTQGVVRLPDGTAIYAEGVVDRPNRSWTGKTYEAVE